MHIGLFGGTFDPPHFGHTLVADQLLLHQYVDEVWYVPVFKHPWADRLDKQFAAYKHRVAMLNLAIGDERPAQRVVEYSGVSYTYDMLEYFSNKHSGYHFSWIMGSEYLSVFGDFLLEHPRLVEYPFLIYPRVGCPVEPLHKCMQLAHQVSQIAISSTQAREAMQSKSQDKKKLASFIDPVVAQYVFDHQLYRR